MFCGKHMASISLEMLEDAIRNMNYKSVIALKILEK